MAFAMRIGLLCCFLMVSGCAATQVALEKKDLEVQTIMSDTIFLDIEHELDRTIFVDVRNTSDKDIEIENLIVKRLLNRGYQLAATPSEANYILQVNVLHVGVADPSALRESVYGGYDGALAGGIGGAIIGSTVGSGRRVGIGAGVGGLLGGAAELVSGSLVKDVTYSMVTDVHISARTKGNVTQHQRANLAVGKGSSVQQTSSSITDRMRYQTRVATSANKVNLKFEEAMPVIEENLSMAIAGVF